MQSGSVRFMSNRAVNAVPESLPLAARPALAVSPLLQSAVGIPEALGWCGAGLVGRRGGRAEQERNS